MDANGQEIPVSYTVGSNGNVSIDLPQSANYPVIVSVLAFTSPNPSELCQQALADRPDLFWSECAPANEDTSTPTVDELIAQGRWEAENNPMEGVVSPAAYSEYISGLTTMRSQYRNELREAQTINVAWHTFWNANAKIKKYCLVKVENCWNFFRNGGDADFQRGRNFTNAKDDITADSTIANAFRHALWNQLNAKDTNEDIAWSFSKWWENEQYLSSHKQTRLRSAMDYWNNNRGIAHYVWWGYDNNTVGNCTIAWHQTKKAAHIGFRNAFNVRWDGLMYMRLKNTELQWVKQAHKNKCAW